MSIETRFCFEGLKKVQTLRTNMFETGTFCAKVENEKVRRAPKGAPSATLAKKARVKVAGEGVVEAVIAYRGACGWLTRTHQGSAGSVPRWIGGLRLLLGVEGESMFRSEVRFPQ